MARRHVLPMYSRVGFGGATRRLLGCIVTFFSDIATNNRAQPGGRGDRCGKKYVEGPPLYPPPPATLFQTAIIFCYMWPRGPGLTAPPDLQLAMSLSAVTSTFVYTPPLPPLRSPPPPPPPPLPSPQTPPPYRNPGYAPERIDDMVI